MEEKSKRNIAFNIFALILILILLTFSKRENQEKFIEIFNPDALVLDEENIINSIPLYEKADNIAYYNNYIFVWQNNSLIRYNEDGSKEGEKLFNFMDPHIVFGNNAIYLCDKNLGDIHYLNLEGNLINRLKIEGEINSLKEYSQYILVHVTEDNKEGIKLLDSNGKLLAKSYIDEGGILNYCLNNKNNIYAYSTLKLENESIRSDLKAISLEGEIIWTYSLEDEIIMYLAFVDEERLVAMSDRGLYFIENGDLSWEMDISPAKDIHVEGDNIYILYDKGYETIALDGTVKDDIFLSEDYDNMALTDDLIILYGDKSIMGIKNKSKVFKYKSDQPIIKVVAGSENLIVLYEDKIDIISFNK